MDAGHRTVYFGFRRPLGGCLEEFSFSRGNDRKITAAAPGSAMMLAHFASCFI
jgi:hypothetical protein